eukprot:GHVS01058566.1.p1 GENE.GHVS01058566.1~~GHVS01058566.1.p1  ORF type:complete len:240 (+),score=55.76 GHVS01058566.1:328-1047(+)
MSRRTSISYTPPNLNHPTTPTDQQNDVCIPSLYSTTNKRTNTTNKTNKTKHKITTGSNYDDKTTSTTTYDQTTPKQLTTTTASHALSFDQVRPIPPLLSEFLNCSPSTEKQQQQQMVYNNSNMSVVDSVAEIEHAVCQMNIDRVMELQAQAQDAFDQRVRSLLKMTWENVELEGDEARSTLKQDATMCVMHRESPGDEFVDYLRQRVNSSQRRLTAYRRLLLECDELQTLCTLTRKALK